MGYNIEQGSGLGADVRMGKTSYFNINYITL